MRGRLISRTIGMLLLSQVFVGCGRHAPEYEVVKPEGEFLELALPRARNLPTRFYTFKSGGKNVNFFVRKDRNGTARTHFDACYSCFKYKMGYTPEGGQVICRACRIGYDLGEPIWDFVGACAPITLSSKASDGKIRIRKRDLERGTQFF